MPNFADLPLPVLLIHVLCVLFDHSPRPLSHCFRCPLCRRRREIGPNIMFFSRDEWHDYMIICDRNVSVYDFSLVREMLSIGLLFLLLPCWSRVLCKGNATIVDPTAHQVGSCGAGASRRPISDTRHPSGTATSDR